MLRHGPGTLTPATTSTRPPCSASIPSTGKIKTHFQYHQNNSWDWDEVEAPMLVDLQRDGRTIKGLIHPGRERDLLGPGAQAGQDQLRSRLALCLHRRLERH